MTIILNSIKDFNLKSLQRIAVDGETVKLGEAALVRIKAANEAFKAFITAHPDQFVYGLTCDYGPRANATLFA